MLRNYSLLIGARGWLHSGWDTEYYPDDLPQDWQLGYYSNDFPVVMLRSREWQQCAEAEERCVANWLEESESSLRFVLELGANDADTDKWQTKLHAFGERLLGVVLVFETLPSAGLLQQRCAQWRQYGPLSVDFSGAEISEDLLAILEQTGTGVCWHGRENSAGLGFSSMAIACVASEDKTPRGLRTIIESMLAVESVEQRVLLFAGIPPSVETMKNAGIILDLL